MGLFRESGHEHFCGSLVIPVLDEAAQVAGMYGRKITEGLRAGTPLHLYLPGPHRGVWNLAGHCGRRRHGCSVRGADRCADVLVRGLSERDRRLRGGWLYRCTHMAAFRAHGVRNVLVAYDHDEAGDRGAAKLAERLAAAGIGCWRVVFPKGMDANAYALKVTPSATKSLGLLLRQAAWMGNGRSRRRIQPC